MSPYCIVRTIIIAFLLMFLSFHAQLQAAAPDKNMAVDHEQIRKTLTDYIEGTANGEPEKLRRAFHPDFKLYTTTEDNQLRIRSGEEYITGFKQGEKNKRQGRIVSIDVADNAAMAKVEVLIPNFRLYTDYFMLMKYDGNWKIVQKSYTWKEASKSAHKILFVTSNQHTYGNTKINTANHFAEIVIAYDIFKQQGYSVDIVSPAGGALPLGYIDTSDPTQKKYLYDADFMNLLANTLAPGQIDAHQYQAVYYSGGGAAMFGVADNRAIEQIASTIYANGGVVSAVCHGTAGIVYLKDSAGKFIFANRKVTGFPDMFEDTEAAYYKTFPYSIDKEISKNGGNFVYSKKWNDNFFVVDGKIITGQDPSATASVARQVIKSIQNIQ
ncbi:MAG: nuclear transport factor 2 family protein [Duganella sp.]